MIDCLTFKESGLAGAEWDNYVYCSDNGTLFHTKKFLNYHIDKEFPDASLVFMKKEQIVALLPAAIIETKEGWTLSSHGGASWGGFVYQSPLKYLDTQRICHALLAHARELACQRIVITLPPFIYQKTPSDYIPFVLLDNRFVYTNRELNSVIRLDVIKDLKQSFAKSAREEISKSERLGIEIEKKSDLWTEFYELLLRFMEDKNKKPTHTLEELLLLKKLFPENIELWTAHKDGQLVGGRCNWQVQSGVWLFFYCAYDQELSSSGILTRLYYECINEYHRSGARFIDLGTSSLAMEVNEGLVANKEHFSAYGIFRDTLCYEF